MCKRKVWLKFFIGLIVFQMVLMPIAPVLAEELSQDDTAIIETVVISEPVTTTVSISEPLRTSTEPVSEQIIQIDNLPSSTTIPAHINYLASSTSIAESVVERLPDYSQIMRRLNGLDQTKEVKSDDFERFIQSEKDRLDKMDLDSSNKSAYFEQLDKQLKRLKNEPPTFIERVVDKTKIFFGLDSGSKIKDEEKFRIPAKPAEFKFNTDELKIQTLQEARNEQTTPRLLDMFNEVFKIDQVSADSQYLPTINDVKADNEAVINSEIQDLATALNNNPVKILNYVRQNISYEPYFGAKKGSMGCLREKVCNDFDTSSLTISLLRAAGIPARYKKSVVKMEVEQIKNLLGVDELKTAYLAWSMNKVPVYTISAGTFNGKAEDYDFSNETALALEWVFVEAFYDYDERGANVDNISSFSSATTTADVQNILQGYSKKQWIPIDAVVKTYNRTKNEIVHDTASFNAQNFWNGFLQYNGTLSPLQKYTQDLKTSTGKDIYNASYQSTNVGSTDGFQILPPTLPYYTHTGEVGGSLIQPIAWSSVPDNYRAQVKISLLKDGDKSVVFEHTFFGNEINNAEINLAYEGATDADKQAIESYGGIHATPAALVNIKPYVLAGYARYDTNNAIKIGDKLILHFDYIQNGIQTYSDEKFSIAGNSEGIAVSLSRVQVDPNLDTNSKILLQGNSALASKYLQHLEETGSTLQKALDYRYNVVFTRAVVTQNRILSEINGTPTTFDFKGLTIDASSAINDWSNRGIYNNHRKDFRLLWGENASYYEGQIFNDITGLEGISTVKGLQFAYAHPADYTVYSITKTNENIIDTLTLTDNTKQNMHTAVQAGDTVVTPNKAITDGTWTGILYIELASDGTGTYAIGEQTQMNGGFMKGNVIVASLTNDLGESKTSYQIDNGYIKFIHRDKSNESINCGILVTKFQQIMSNVDSSGNAIPPGEAQWKQDYGWPCMDENEKGPYKFGNYEHRFILATDGAKFYSPGKYNYWKSDSDIEFEFKKLYHYHNNLPKSECTSPMQWKNGYCFIAGGQYEQNNIKPYWGTYVYENKYFAYTGDKGRIVDLGVYNPEQKIIHKIEGRMYEKYISPNQIQNKFVPNLLGYPISDSKRAAPSPKGTTGLYQEFLNGTLYEVFYIFSDDVYVTYGLWNEKIKTLGGSGSVGFPESDAGMNFSYGVVTQKFEKKVCVDNITSISCNDKTFTANFKNGLEGVYDSIWLTNAGLTLRKNNLVLNDYDKFVQQIDYTANTSENRGYFCRLYKAEYLQSLFMPMWNYGEASCWFPNDISHYQSKKGEIQNKIITLKNENNNEFYLIGLLQDSIKTQVDDASFGASEWLGYFAVDIATIIVGPATKIGSTVVKNISLKIASRYSVELTAKEVDRVVLNSILKKELSAELGKIGTNVTEDALEETVDRVTVKAAKQAGSKGFTKGLNPIRWDITISGRSKITNLTNGLKIKTNLGKNSEFVSEFLNDGKDLIIKMAFKGNITDPAFHSSNVILDQYYYATGKSFINLKNVKLDTVINKEAIDLVEKFGKGAFMDSPIGKMAGWVIKDSGKEIDKVVVGDMIYDKDIIIGKYFNVEIILK